MDDMTTDTGRDARERIVAAAMALLARDGRDALTTRAVAALAGVQAPTIYRLFGDKQGLLDAVAERGFETYLAEKTALKRKRNDYPSADPVDDLRIGWDLHVGFGLAHPAIYVAMYGNPRPGRTSPAATRGFAMLRERMRSLALAGRLRVAERQAADMVHAAACGVVLRLLATPDDGRDAGLSEATREAIIAAITTAAPSPEQLGLTPVATTLRALLPDAHGLTEGERRLLDEWLERLARSAEETR